MDSTPVLLDWLRNALDYKRWADQRTGEAARGVDPVQHPTTFDFIRQQLNHLVIVEELFRARLSGQTAPHAVTNTRDRPPLPELLERLDRSNEWLRGYLTRRPADDLSERIDFHFTDGQAGSMNRLEILFHLINHGTYHRGAIGHALDRAGAPRPADTYTVYIHAAHPARRHHD
jgi:uncharacterized damage-inducible protein DinB